MTADGGAARAPRLRRILLVLDTCHGQIGGTELNTIQLARQLVRRGFDPVIAEIGVPILASIAHECGVKAIHVAATNFSDVGWAAWRRVLQRTAPDIVVRSKGWWHCINWRLDVLVRLAGATYFSWEHHPADTIEKDGVDPVRGRLPFFLLRLKRRLRWRIHIDSVCHMIAVSHAVRNPIMHIYGVAPEKIEVIYPGVDFSELRRQAGDRPRLHRQWNIASGASVIGSLGRLVPHKRNEIVLEVFSALIHAQPESNLWCVIAGTGPDLTRLQGIAETLGVAHRVRFPGWQARAATTWSAIDVFLMPSSDEGLGMSLIEAIGCGCLPLAIGTGGMWEILDGPLEEYRIAPQDIGTWVAKTLQILNETAIERQQRADRAATYLRERFDATQQWNKMVDCLDRHSA